MLRFETMKLRYVTALPLLLLASCTPSIKQSTIRAEAAADRAKRSATLAEQSADQALKASARALIAADQAQDAVRRANDAVARVGSEPLHGFVPGELLEKPTEGSLLRWCLMGPPDVVPSDMTIIDVHAPRSKFWVYEIFDSKSDCHGGLRKYHRLFVRSMEKDAPFKAFCAACANEADDDEN
jgi:hypothetical protein